MAIKPIKILVICATGLATSTLASVKLQEQFSKHNIPCKVTTGRITDMSSLVNMSKPDVVVATAVTNMDVGVKVFNGTSLLTGIGVEQLVEDMIKYLGEEGLLD